MIANFANFANLQLIQGRRIITLFKEHKYYSVVITNIDYVNQSLHILRKILFKVYELRMCYKRQPL